jgi:hypothetical protein
MMGPDEIQEYIDSKIKERDSQEYVDTKLYSHIPYLYNSCIVTEGESISEQALQEKYLLPMALSLCFKGVQPCKASKKATPAGILIEVECEVLL